MDIDELRHRMGAILAAEERRPADWEEVASLTLQLKGELLADTDTPEIVDHYLDNLDIRIRSGEGAYAKAQRDEVRRFVITGDHSSGTTVPLWACSVAVALAIAIIAWLVS